MAFFSEMVKVCRSFNLSPSICSGMFTAFPHLTRSVNAVSLGMFFSVKAEPSHIVTSDAL